jgi:hypothetical protein
LLLAFSLFVTSSPRRDPVHAISPNRYVKELSLCSGAETEEIDLAATHDNVAGIDETAFKVCDL